VSLLSAHGGLAASHLFLKHLEGTETIFDVTTLIRGCRKIDRRPSAFEHPDLGRR
jgi:hypothetical protein